jgi:hypothetical protein
MSELEQDQYLRREALRSAWSHPAHVLQLAGVKFLRYWNPLPNAAEGQSWPIRLLSLLSSGPVLLCAAIAAWRLRDRGWIVALLAGPVVYFCVIHLVFVSSIRYREAAMLPVLGLAAACWRRPLPQRRPSG